MPSKPCAARVTESDQMPEVVQISPLRSAAYRIALVYSGAFVLATLLLGLMVYLAAHAALVRQLDAQVEGTALDLKARYAEEGRQDLIESIRAREQLRSADELGFALFGANGRRIAGNMVTELPHSGWSNITFRDPHEGRDPARALAIDLPDGTRLVVAADREPLEAIDPSYPGYIRHRLAGDPVVRDCRRARSGRLSAWSYRSHRAHRRGDRFGRSQQPHASRSARRRIRRSGAHT